MTTTINKFLTPLILVALFLALLLTDTTAAPLCKIDTKDFSVCLPAVAPPPGQPLQLPTEGCCSVVRRADLKCLCKLKSVLPSLGINPTNALALPSKCDIQAPSECHSP